MTRLPDLGARGEGWVAAQLVLLLAVVLGAVVGSPPTGLATVADWLRLVIGGGAVVLALVAANVGAAHLGESLTAVPHPKPGASLVERGIYARVRHPIYAALIVGSAGWSLLWASWGSALATVVLAVVLDAKARREESWLREQYPTYEAYQRRTKRFLPGIY